ncbi:MAG: DNA replication/repair protein RecF [Eubacteriales bacterium]|nr:DNA replication/repair protein RecF [Eubacteriales bacterium]
MYCDSIQYINFRNIGSAEIRPERGVNILYGSNAEGKTNALEGIYMFANGRSFRSAKERELIKFGENLAAIKLKFTDKNRSHELEIRFSDKGKRMFRRNGVCVARLSEFVGSFRAVVFCPNHLSIVKEGPSARRYFLDSSISQIKPAFIKTLQRYSGILEQRNSLLKNYYDHKTSFEETIDVWSEQLAAEAVNVSSERAEYIELLNERIKELFAVMSGGEEVPELSYSKARTAEEYLSLLTGSIEREIKAQTTLYGPHRDDMDILINGREARLYGSQGQQRSLAIALKIAEGEISKEFTGEYPVFLFDDILSELDERRRDFLLSGLDGKQVIITSCDRSSAGSGVCFYVKNGTYTALQ